MVYFLCLPYSWLFLCSFSCWWRQWFLSDVEYLLDGSFWINPFVLDHNLDILVLFCCSLWSACCGGLLAHFFVYLLPSYFMFFFMLISIVAPLRSCTFIGGIIQDQANCLDHGLMLWCSVIVVSLRLWWGFGLVGHFLVCLLPSCFSFIFLLLSEVVHDFLHVGVSILGLLVLYIEWLFAQCNPS